MVHLRYMNANLFVTIAIIHETFVRADTRSNNFQKFSPTPQNTGVFDAKYNAEVVSQKVRNWRRGDKHNVEEYSELYDGDIMLTKEQKRTGEYGPGKIWSRGEIPYYIGLESFSLRQIAHIRSVLDVISNHTCVKFRRYDSTIDHNYVVFRSNNTGCWSYVGMKQNGQVINLQIPNCLYRGTITHVVLHALGFYHQHNSPVRDSWIKLVWENVIEPRKTDFKMLDGNVVRDSDILYDYESIMHGGPFLHAIKERPTLVPQIKDIKIGQREALSIIDVEKIRINYREECQRWVPIEELPNLKPNSPTAPTGTTELSTVTKPIVTTITYTDKTTSEPDTDETYKNTSDTIITTDRYKTTTETTRTTTFPPGLITVTDDPPLAETTILISEESNTPPSAEYEDTSEPTTSYWEHPTTEEDYDYTEIPTVTVTFEKLPGADNVTINDGTESSTQYPERTPGTTKISHQTSERTTATTKLLHQTSERTTATTKIPHHTSERTTTMKKMSTWYPNWTTTRVPKPTIDKDRKIETTTKQRILNMFCIIWPYSVDEDCF